MESSKTDENTSQTLGACARPSPSQSDLVNDKLNKLEQQVRDIWENMAQLVRQEVASAMEEHGGIL